MIYYNKMQFCPECKFMLYTKLLKPENTLINYCKNCNWSGELEDINTCIYKRNYVYLYRHTVIYIKIYNHIRVH